MGTFEPTSNVHTAPIWVTLRSQPDIATSARSKGVARSWLARLENLERALAVENLDALAERLVVPNFDAVPREVLMNNREELLAEIQLAKEFFLALRR